MKEQHVAHDSFYTDTDINMLKSVFGGTVRLSMQQQLDDQYNFFFS